MEIIEIAVDDLKPYEKNPRKNEASVKFVANSIKEFGFKVPVVVSPDNVIICGHTRWKAAKQLGIETVPCIVANDLNDAKIKAYRLADNKVGEYSEWNMGLLGEELKELEGIFDVDMADFGFLDTDLLTEDGPTGDDEDFDVDKETEEIVDPITKPGDIWILGRHRLMCGDSTDVVAVEKMMDGSKARMVFTDPPWNVAYGSNVDKGNAQKYKVRTILNDSMTTEQFHDFMNGIFASMKIASEPGCPTYVVMSAQEWGNLMLSLKDNGYHWSSTIIWAKDTLVLSRKDYHTQYEPIWYGWEDSASRLKNVEDRKQSDLWQIPRPKKSEIHPTMKPVELVERAINNSSNPGDVVLDLFGGSGTTIIACEQTGRFGRSMELDPKYCDAITKRFVNLKGADSVFLLKPDGEKVPYSEIAK
ncbi:MAG: ParB N-terminal domain-containing protein [Fibrobacter sp.]|nr:ParB N-terminal domain-containing protein [Fibrobacter sp.]